MLAHDNHLDEEDVYHKQLHCRRRTVLTISFSFVLLTIAFLGTMLTIPLAAQEPSPDYDPAQVTPPTTPPVALFGETSYQQNCAPCHGAEGMGDGPTASSLPGPATAFADPEAIWERSPAQLFHTTKFGRIQNLMPPWQNQLSDEEIWQAVAYAWSLHTSRNEIEAGTSLYDASCAACHGLSGAGDGPDASVDMVDFRDLSYTTFRSQADWQDGWQNAHPELGADWDEEQVHQVLEYIRTFSYVPPWGATYRAGNGIIQGAAVQRTPGGDPVAGLTASLEAYAGFTPVAVFTTTVDATGAYTFTELATDPSINYLTSVNSSGIRYSSAILNFAAGTDRMAAEVAIYATTEDPAAIRMNRVHWIVEPRPGAVLVIEVYGVGNSGDRTYVGTMVNGVERTATVAIPVPEAAQQLSFENGVLGERFQRVGDLVYDTTPVLPGTDSRQIIMRYLLPVEDRALTLSRSFGYPVDEMSLLIADLPQLEVEIPGFALASRESFQNQTFQLWQAEGAIPAALTLQLSGLLAADDSDPRLAQGASGQAGGTAVTAVQLLTPWVTWSTVALLLLVMAGLLAWAGQQRRLSAVPAAEEWEMQRKQLLARIARLDDRHAIGELDETSWQGERAMLKAQLLQIVQRQDLIDKS